jgi:hypothetical protein
MDTKKDNSDTPMIVLVCGILTLALAAVNLTYGNFGGMFDGADKWVGIVWVVAHALILINWIVVLKYENDPARDMFRSVLIALLFGAIALVSLHRSGWIEDKQVIIDSRENQSAR